MTNQEPDLIDTLEAVFGKENVIVIDEAYKFEQEDPMEHEEEAMTRETMESQHPLAYQTAEKFLEWLNMWQEKEGDILLTMDNFFEFPGTTEILAEVVISFRYTHIIMYAGYGDEGGSSLLLATWDKGWSEGDTPQLVNMVQEFDTSFSTIWGQRPYNPNPTPTWLVTPATTDAYFAENKEA
jgi:hypothetical protein